MRSVQLEISTSLIIKIALVLVALMTLWEVRGIVITILVMLFIAFIISAGLRPLVDSLQKNLKLPRAFSIFVIYIGLIAALVLAVVLIASQFTEQVVDLIRSLPSIFQTASRFIKEQLPFLAQVIPLDALNQELSQFASQLLNSETFKNLASGENVLNIARQALGLFSSVAELLVGIVTVLMVSIYMLVRSKPAYEGVLGLLPEKQTKPLRNLLKKVETSLGGWMLGQLIAMVTVGVITYLLIIIPGLFDPTYVLDDFALPLALLAGLLEALPNIGPLITLVMTAVLALGTSGVAVVIYIIIAFTALQQLEGIVIIPLVMKKAVGVDPILSILGIIAGFYLGGIVGAILAIPTIGIFQIIIVEASNEYKRLDRQRPKLME